MRLRHSGDLRRAHRVEVMRCFYGGEPRTRQELASRLGLSVATIGTIAGELTKAGFLKETAGPRTGGRPAAQLTLRGGGSLVVGVDVTETHVTAELFDQAMARLARKRVPVLESAPDAVVEQVLEAVGAVRQQVYEAPVRAIGVSLPEHRFRALLERRCDVPVVLDQPLKAMTLAEQTFGAARDQDDVIVVDLGTGAGLGVVSGGRLLRGATNSAGEWGHAVLHAGALTDLLDGSPFLVPGDQEATVARFAEAVRQGGFTALETLNRFSRKVAPALADAVALLDPGLIVFGGWVGAALGEPLVAAVTPVIKEYALGTCFEAATTALGGHQDNPVSLGMAVLAFETHLLD